SSRSCRTHEEVGMHAIRRLWSTVRGLAPGAEQELDDELRFHIEQQVAVNLETGMRPEEARRQALIAFGGMQQVKEDCRDVHRLAWLESTLRDFRFALRMLRKSPGFTTVAVLTLALGIGANTTIFSAVQAVLLRALPYPEPGRLVYLQQTLRNGQPGWFSGPDLQDYRDQNHTLLEIAGLVPQSVNLTGGGREPDRVIGCFATPNLFRLLGVQPSLGRTYTQEEDQPGKPGGVVLSHSTWQFRFGGDPAILGKELVLNGVTYTVVGVLPASFTLAMWGEPDVYLPSTAYPNYRPLRNVPSFGAIGRLKPGVTLRQAQADLTAIAGRLAHAYPNESVAERVEVKPLHELFSAQSRTTLLVLMAAVAFILLIACANVANLLLARGGGGPCLAQHGSGAQILRHASDRRSRRSPRIACPAVRPDCFGRDRRAIRHRSRPATLAQQSAVQPERGGALERQPRARPAAQRLRHQPGGTVAGTAARRGTHD